MAYIPYVEKTSHLQVIQFCFAKISQINFMFKFWFRDQPLHLNIKLITCFHEFWIYECRFCFQEIF